MNRLIKFTILTLTAFIVLIILFHGVSYTLYVFGVTSEYLSVEDFKRNYYIALAASVGFALGESIHRPRKKSRD